ncbi:hypothetical protein EYF80_021055 [Liparis tanakae]|uniref:Uncharacterized protein n=1 Tax=Liparis tanakae TaxID=230148 RepID=A0A4Z2HUV4_9TELE|nr:hypothetical protein EYF80_021055 [Liparis tanakae]
MILLDLAGQLDYHNIRSSRGAMGSQRHPSGPASNFLWGSSSQPNCKFMASEPRRAVVAAPNSCMVTVLDLSKDWESRKEEGGANKNRCGERRRAKLKKEMADGLGKMADETRTDSESDEPDE